MTTPRKAEIFYDNLDTVGPGVLVVKARVTLEPTLKNGRRGDYRPNHNFGEPSNQHFFIGRILLGESNELPPGQTREVIVEFFHVRGLAERLTPGARWRIQEGSMVVGVAEVIEFLGSR